MNTSIQGLRDAISKLGHVGENLPSIKAENEDGPHQLSSNKGSTLDKIRRKPKGKERLL